MLHYSSEATLVEHKVIRMSLRMEDAGKKITLHAQKVIHMFHLDLSDKDKILCYSYSNGYQQCFGKR